MIRALTKSVDETRLLAAELATLLEPDDVVVLSGDLGSGKTAFTQGLARGLGVSEQVTSPAFVLARSYDDGRLPLVHLDVYRLDHLQDLVDIGIAELVDSGNVTVVEWGDVVLPVLPPDHLEVHLEVGDADEERLLGVTVAGRRWAGRLPALRRALDPWLVAERAC